MEQEKKVKELEDKNNKMISNFNGLQSEYDQKEDLVEEQKKEIGSLKKDLEVKVKELVEVKEELEGVKVEGQKLEGKNY